EPCACASRARCRTSKPEPVVQAARLLGANAGEPPAPRRDRCRGEVMLRERCAGRGRPGATLIESAVVLALTFLLLFAILIGALGVFQRQQVAALAREGARYASV